MYLMLRVIRAQHIQQEPAAMAGFLFSSGFIGLQTRALNKPLSEELPTE